MYLYFLTYIIKNKLNLRKSHESANYENNKNDSRRRNDCYFKRYNTNKIIYTTYINKKKIIINNKSQ